MNDAIDGVRKGLVQRIRAGQTTAGDVAVLEAVEDAAFDDGFGVGYEVNALLRAEDRMRYPRFFAAGGVVGALLVGVVVTVVQVLA